MTSVHMLLVIWTSKYLFWRRYGKCSIGPYLRTEIFFFELRCIFLSRFYRSAVAKIGIIWKPSMFRDHCHPHGLISYLCGVCNSSYQHHQHQIESINLPIVVIYSLVVLEVVVPPQAVSCYILFPGNPVLYCCHHYCAALWCLQIIWYIITWRSCSFVYITLPIITIMKAYQNELNI